MTLKEQLQVAFHDLPDESFDTYASDLYVLYRADVWQWLQQHYKYARNCRIETSNVSGQPWFGKRFIDIPFAAM